VDSETFVSEWRLRRINDFMPDSRLELGWVTVLGRANHLCKFM